MARGRMLNKEVSESDSFAALKDSDSQLLCVLLTPWWDDWGKMIGDEDWIRGNIVRKLPQFTIKNISRCLKNISAHVDVAWWTDKNTGNKYLYWAKFDIHEKINEAKRTKDHLPSPELSKKSPGNPQENPRIPQERFGKVPNEEEVEEEVEVEEEGGKGKIKEIPPPDLSPLSEKEKEFFAVYEKHLGTIPSILVPELRLAANAYPLDWITDAFITMMEAHNEGKVDKPCWKYVNSILIRWATQGRDVAKSKKKQQLDDDPNEFARRYGHLVKHD